MTMPPALGRLEPVDIRNCWVREATDFTPWLAQEENLAFLGDAIGMELQLVAQERSVGPFRADILCKDMNSGEWVLIENQLERTDHTHLGQLITYAAGLHACSIVWIAQQFNEEHRAALDWLNEYTVQDIKFFGMEIELWRIGASNIAPRLNVVCKPNNWTRSAAASRDNAQNLESSFRVRYWIEFLKNLQADAGPLRITKPLDQNWHSFAIGRSGFSLNPVVNPRDKWIRVEVYINGASAKDNFRQLFASKAEVERALGVLDWQELPTKRDCRIAITRPNVDPTSEADWRDQHVWLTDRCKAFHRVFAPIVRQLQQSPIETVTTIDTTSDGIVRIDEER